VQSEPESAWLVRQAPRRLRGDNSAAQDLAAIAGTDPDQTEQVLKKYLLRGSALRASASSRFPIFAFRLHQFLAIQSGRRLSRTQYVTSNSQSLCPSPASQRSRFSHSRFAGIAEPHITA
jgi:hypothetical protein